MITYKMADVVKEISVRENNPATSKYDKFVGLEHYITGEVVIRQYGGTGMLNSAMKVFQAGDILVARRNVYLRRASTVDFDGLTSGDSIVLRAENPRIAKLLPFILNSDRFWDYADQHADGTMSKRLSPKILMQYEFTLPSEEEQDRLIELLWSMDRTKQAYKQLISATDELVKSQFIEMSVGAKGVPTRMGDLATYINGAAFKPSDWSNTGKPIIRIQNLNDPSAPYNYFGGQLDTKYEVHTGDVLISWATHLEAYIWNGGDSWLNQHIFRVDFNKGTINKLFFIHAANEALKEAFKKAHGFKATMEHIKRNDFEDSIVYIPDLTIQEQFASFVRQTDKSKFELNQALEALNATYKKLISENLG